MACDVLAVCVPFLACPGLVPALFCFLCFSAFISASDLTLIVEALVALPFSPDPLKAGVF